jgi:hypothetical protein
MLQRRKGRVQQLRRFVPALPNSEVSCRLLKLVTAGTLSELAAFFQWGASAWQWPHLCKSSARSKHKDMLVVSTEHC